MFFFEKKNQKTFVPVHGHPRSRPWPENKSLFASFSSEKEDLPSSHGESR
jgi:hypothetical protein